MCVRSVMSDSLQPPWTAAHQAPLSMEFSRQEYSSGLQFLPPGDLPDLGIKMTSPILAGRFFTSVPPGSDTVLKLKKSKCASSLNKDSVNQSKPIPWWLSGKESTCQCRRRGLNSWIGKIPWRRKWQPPLIFLPGKFHGQRSLAGCSPWGRRELDAT